MRWFLFVVLIFSLVFPQVGFSKKNDFTLAREKISKNFQKKILFSKWSLTLKSGHPQKSYVPEESELLYHDGVLYVGTHGGYFYAVETKRGKILWRYKNDEPIATKPTVSGDKVFFTDLGCKVIALNLSDGSLVWTQNFDREMLGRPLAVGGLILLLKDEQEVIALSQESGALVWNRFLRTYIPDMTMRGHSSLLVEGDRIYFGLADGQIYVLNPREGQILWQKSLSVPLSSFKDIDEAFVISGDSLYVAGYSGKMYRLNKSNGQILWSASVKTGVRPLVFGELVIASDLSEGLVGFDKATGKQMWSNELEGSVLSAPVLYQDTVFVSTVDGSAFLVDPNTGTSVQRLSVAPGAITSPVVAEDHLFLLSHSAKLLAFGPK